MTLDEAIKYLEKMVEIEETYEVSKVVEEHSQLAEWLKELKQLREQTRWIPVSERMPKNSGVYIISRWFFDGLESAILTDACYFDGTSTWHDDNRINHGREYVDKKIVAWMLLPEPYKAESEDKK